MYPPGIGLSSLNAYVLRLGGRRGGGAGCGFSKPPDTPERQTSRAEAAAKQVLEDQGVDELTIKRSIRRTKLLYKVYVGTGYPQVVCLDIKFEDDTFEVFSAADCRRHRFEP
jgi:hypothetical protein